MSLTRTQLLDRILQSYGSSYDVVRCEEADAPLVATAVFHEHSTSYMVVKKAEMWAADRHEYTFFFSVPHLTQADAAWCLEKTLELGQPQVKPGKNHMCSNLVCVVLCDTAEDEALNTLKKCRIRKSFHFSLHGWMEVQTAAAIMGKDAVVSNSAGRNVAEFLKNVLHPKTKRRSFLRK